MLLSGATTEEDMKTLVAALSCALVAAACEGRPPARDPSYGSTSTTAAPSENYGNASSSTIYSSENARSRARSAPANTAAPADPPATTAAEETAAVQRQIQQQTLAEDANTAGPRPAPAQPSVSDNPGAADRSKGADSTRNNDRDRHGTVTPGDQGNSTSETKITADIRKGLMASKSLSFTAKNAKIITTGTKVTLRGTVKSDAEKAEIEGVAKSTAGVSEVDNQLEVKK
jgi:osmotically-inducible protein OsmY